MFQLYSFGLLYASNASNALRQLVVSVIEASITNQVEYLYQNNKIKIHLNTVFKILCGAKSTRSISWIYYYFSLSLKLTF